MKRGKETGDCGGVIGDRKCRKHQPNRHVPISCKFCPYIAAEPKRKRYYR